MKRAVKDWLKITVLLLDEAAAVVGVLLALWYFEVKIPPAAAITGGLALGVVIFVVHKAVIPTFHKKQITGAEGMAGRAGLVTEALSPVGMVRIGGETWRARCDGETIGAGEEIEVISLDGLTLTVKRKT